MYAADYHMHCRWSPDARYPMREMAEAAVKAGLDEICFTDHVELFDPGDSRPNVFDWAALDAEYEDARSAAEGRLIIRRGAELGEAPRDFPQAERVLREMPPPDFIIGSIHEFSEAFGRGGLYEDSSTDPAEAERQITDYLERVLRLAGWGRFSVLGHLTLPLRYMNEDRGMHMSFDGRESEIAEIFRTLISRGCGIEINTNRGHTPLPDARWLKLYRSLGGEIVTIGSDAHSPGYVGCRVREAQQMLRECGFLRYCTFSRLEPVFHALS